MLDVLYVALMIIFGLVAWGFIAAMDKILGPDDAAMRETHREQTDEAAPRRSSRRIAA